jgi:choline kinase
MAAGMGSRYGGNKQIDPITDQGEIIMDFSLYDAHRAGFKRVVFVIKEEFEETFRAHIESHAGKVYETHYAFQRLDDIPAGYEVPEDRIKPWGTGHAVLAAREFIDAPFAVINSDDYYGVHAFKEIYDYLVSDADASHQCMVGFNIENTLSENGTVARGICKEADGKLADIEEHLEIGRCPDGAVLNGEDVSGRIVGTNTAGDKVVIEDGTPVSMNLWGFGREFIEKMKSMFEEDFARIIKENPLKGEFFLPLCIDLDIKAGNSEVALLKSPDKWFGITYKEDKPAVVAKFAEMKNAGLYPSSLW